MTDEELIAFMRKPPHTSVERVAADRIEALLRDLKSARIRIEIVQAACLGLSEQLMKAHTEIAQALGKAGGEG